MESNVATVDWANTPTYTQAELDAAAESMVWTCGQYSHPPHPDYHTCICGQPD